MKLNHFIAAIVAVCLTIGTAANTRAQGVNLALNKVASTSSRSQWSKANDAQGAVDGVKNGSFGFHTKDEVNPWWQVDLGSVTRVHTIVIFNRQDCCSERARTIQVLTSEDGMNFRNVYGHDGSVFGGVKDGKPLTVTLRGVKARYVRLQLNEKNALHLDEVEIYGKAPREGGGDMGGETDNMSSGMDMGNSGGSNPGVTLYEHGGFGGASKIITSDWDCTSDMTWNDRISSIRIPAGYKIQVFEHSQFGGVSKILTSDWSAEANTPQAFNDFISSIKILEYPKASGITLYEHGNFAGATKIITSDWDCSSDMSWNDRISSIRIPRGYKIQVFEHSQFGGASKILTSDWSAEANTPQAFNDFISSIKILEYPKASGSGGEASSDWTSSGYHSEKQMGKYTSWSENWRLPEAGRASIVFKATARNDIHIAFSDAASTIDPMYEIVIGGWNNTKCAVRRRSQGPSIAEAAGAVRRPGVMDDYWAKVDKDKKTISVGSGTIVGQNVIIETKDANFLGNVQYFAFSSFNTPIDYADVQIAALAEEVPTGIYVRTLQKSYFVGQTVVVEYNDFPKFGGPWITVIPKGQKEDQWGNYQYTAGKSGKLEFNGLKPGEYEVRGYFKASDYTVKARYSFRVEAGGQ